MKHLFYFIFVASILISCTKQVDTSGIATPTTPTTGSTVAPSIRFFNVMDYGNDTVLINTASTGALARYYPTAYLKGVIGSNNIQVIFGGNTVVNVNVNLLAGSSYSCFIYRVGYDWKVSVVADDLSTPTAGNTKVRVLDFRTQAYFSYINVHFSSPGNLSLDYTYRNFLDHLSFDTYTVFKTITAGTYTITLSNSSTGATLKTVSNVVFASTKIYSVILMTQASQTAADALNNIQVDVEQHY
ncbi:hypothetical protein [Parasediminibacterium sp. JCM 36343]|uniref:hypothetical protein n=1 Tax=Parasediminibacterium sp. JCM 36343 TaxID=3374279 RepID=UPI0039795A52